MGKSLQAQAMPRMSNADLWNKIRATYPSFKSVTSEGTLEWFNERTFEQLKTNNPQLLNDFFGLSMRVYFQMITVARAKDDLEGSGFGETYDQPWGAYTQRMAINSIQPVSPAYRNLQNYDTVDPYVIKKPEVSERFYEQNFDFQSLVTIPDEFQFKTLFVAENGMSELMGGIFTALQNGYTKQKFLAKLEALNVYLNSTDFPLLPTQVLDVPIPADGIVTNRDTLRAFIYALKNIYTYMTLGPSTNAFNKAGFDTTVEGDRLVIICRPWLANLLDVYLLESAYNQDRLSIPFKFVPVKDFGGLQPMTPDGTAVAYPVYDKLGSVIGFSATEGAATATWTASQITYTDPNEDVLAIIADRGLLFETIQNPYEVQPIYNPRGKYTNYWANSPGNGIHVDNYYPAVVVKYDPSTAPTPETINALIINTPENPVNTKEVAAATEG